MCIHCATSRGVQVAIWAITMKAGAALELPRADDGVNRRLYFFSGSMLEVGDVSVEKGLGAVLDASKPITLRNGDTPGEALVLQGRPIAEPVVQHGPFVMNSQDEIGQAFADYRAGSFGTWGWGKADPVHKRDERRFANRDGQREVPP